MTTTKENGLFVIRGKFLGVDLCAIHADKDRAREKMADLQVRTLQTHGAFVPDNWVGAL